MIKPMLVATAVLAFILGYGVGRFSHTTPQQSPLARGSELKSPAPAPSSPKTQQARESVYTHEGYDARHTSSCGPFYAVRPYALEGYDRIVSTNPRDLPALALQTDLFGEEQEYVIVERVGAFTIKGPPIEIVRPNGGKTVEGLELSDCADGKTEE